MASSEVGKAGWAHATSSFGCLVEESGLVRNATERHGRINKDVC